MSYLVAPDDLPEFQSGRAGIAARVLNGGEHGVPGISIILNQTEIDDGASWQEHTYDELFVIQEGRCHFTIGEQTVDASSGQIVLAPANIPHTFRNPGPGLLRMVAVHAAPAVVWKRSNETAPDP